MSRQNAPSAMRPMTGMGSARNACSIFFSAVPSPFPLTNGVMAMHALCSKSIGSEPLPAPTQ